MKFAILEIGSTNTKCYIYENGKLKNFAQKYIPLRIIIVRVWLNQILAH